MSDEQNIELEVPENTESVKQKQPTASKYEEQALTMGWRPKEEWEGDDEDYVDAKEYVKRKSFFDKISIQSKEIKELKETLEQFKEHYSKVEEHARKQALVELKNRKKLALEEGDADAIVEIDEAIADFKLQEKDIATKAAAAKEVSNIPPELQAWKERNSWFGTDAEMTDEANALAIGYKAMGKEPVEILSLVETKIKRMYKEKFPAKKPAAPVEGGNSGGRAGSGSANSRYNPSDEEKKIASKFVKQGIYKTVDEYYAQLKKLNGGD